MDCTALVQQSICSLRKFYVWSQQFSKCSFLPWSPLGIPKHHCIIEKAILCPCLYVKISSDTHTHTHTHRYIPAYMLQINSFSLLILAIIVFYHSPLYTLDKERMHFFAALGVSMALSLKLWVISYLLKC